MTDDGIQVHRKRPPFAQIPHALLRDPTVSDKALRLWVVLDTYADRDERDCFPSVARLCEDLGCSRATINRAQGELVDRGLLFVESGKDAGRSNVYTLVDPIPGDPGVNHGRVRGSSPVKHPGSSPTRHKQDSVEQESLTLLATPSQSEDCKTLATSDPIKRTAHRLTIYAFEQTPKPVTRGGFPAVMARIEAELRAGTTDKAIKAAIDAGDVTWTADALRNAISRARPQQRRRGGGDGDERSLPELLAAASAAERSNA